MRPFVAFLLAAAAMLSTVLLAQDPMPRAAEQPGFKAIDVPTAAGVARHAGELPKEGTCRVTFCVDDLSRILIHDTKGILVLNARSLDIKVSRIGESPTVVCKLYDGIFEPTNPPTKTWKLAEMRFVEQKEFQKLVDQGVTVQADGSVTPAAGPPSGVDLKNVTPLIPEAPPTRATPTNPPAPGAN